MAYVSRDLSVLAYANGFTLWLYNPPEDTLEAMARDGYFNPAADMLRTGDLIVVSRVHGPRGAEKGQGCILHVAGVDGGVVDVESITPGGLLFFGGMAAMDNGGDKAAR